MRSIQVASILCAVAACPPASARQAPEISQAPDRTVFVPDRPVDVIEARGNRIYVGGGFSAVGPHTGPFALKALGAGPPLPSWPALDGEVRDVEPDGDGGWFLAGTFSLAGTLEVDGLAHLLPNGSVDAWAPKVDGEVHALALDGGVLHVGGRFTAIDGAARSSLAAFDASTLQPLPWNPAAGVSLSSGEGVFALECFGGVVYAGGFFDEVIGGNPRRNLFAADQATGAITPFDPSPNGRVNAVLAEAGVIWVGGNFYNIGQAFRDRIAAIDPSTSLATPFAIGANKDVHALARDGSTLFAAGAFTTLGGLPRAQCGAIDLSTVSVTSFSPAPSKSGNEVLEVRALTVDAGVVYLGGSFRMLGDAQRRHVGAVSAATGEVLDFTADVAGENWPSIRDLVVSDGVLGIAGAFFSVGAVRRHGVAAFDADTLELLPWAPDVGHNFLPDEPGSVSAFAFLGSKVYLGGAFGFVNGSQRPRIAAVDVLTGATVDTFDSELPLNADGVRNLTMVPGGVLADVNRLVDRDTGIEDRSWNAQSNTPPLAVEPAPGGGRILVGGSFSEVSDGGGTFVTAKNLVEFDAATGSPVTGLPEPDKRVEAIHVDAGGILVGGAFDSVGGTIRRRLAEIDPATGALTSFAPVIGGFADSGVLAVDAWPSLVLCGGSFGSVNAGSVPYLAVLDRATAVSILWTPKPDANVLAVAAHRDLVIAGGQFRKLGTGPRPYLAIFRLTTLFANETAVSVSAGGAQSLSIAAGKALAGRSHWILGTATGTAPGLDLLGKHLPLTLDAYLLYGLANPIQPFLPGGFGVLDGSGNAAAQFVLPAGGPPSLVGVVLRHAALVFDPVAGKLLFVTNAAPVLLEP